MIVGQYLLHGLVEILIDGGLIFLCFLRLGWLFKDLLEGLDFKLSLGGDLLVQVVIFDHFLGDLDEAGLEFLEFLDEE